ADAEIVLEAEILPTGWTYPEGRFGEFTRLMGGLHWNPLVRIKAVAMRRDAVYYALHMPWENTWLAAPTRYTAIRQALRNAGVVPTTAKVGIDATIPEGVPRERYERIAYAYADRARIDDYLAGQADKAGEGGDDAKVEALAAKIVATIAAAPLYYTDVAERFSAYDFRTVARALGHLHATEKLWQDPRGRLCVRGSEFAAKPPGR